MTDDQLISHQAKRLAELEDKVAELRDRINKAYLHIICIGGPLNDNKLNYSQAQLVTFSKIEEELDLP